MFPVLISKAEYHKGVDKNPELKIIKESVKAKKLEQREVKNLQKESANSNANGKLKSQACENIASTFSKRISVMESSISKRKQSMSNIENAIQNRISILKATGNDISKIETSFASFKELSEKYILERELVLSKLKETSIINCETSKTELIKSVKDFNILYKNHNKKNIELKDILKKTVIEPLKLVNNSNKGEQ